MSYRMRNIIPTALIGLLMPLIGASQIQIAKLLDGDVELNSVPALAIDFGLPINITGPYAFIRSKDMYMESGLFFTTDKYIFDRDTTRFSHRSVGINIPLRVGAIIKEKIYVGAGHNFNFPIHYRQNNYDAGGFDNKRKAVSEFFSDHIMRFYPSMELSAGISIHTIGRFSVRLQMHYLDFFNLAYEENGVKPYETLVFENRFKFIIISYNPGL